ncbi:MAG: hypothetical protein AAF266_05895 [Planctomycetota bacterium]
MRRNPFSPLTKVLVALALSHAGCGGSTDQPTAEPQPVTPTQPAESVSQPSASIEPAPPSDGLVEDDGRTLWASPTNGESIDLSIVPDGSQLVLHIRPKALLVSDEGQRVWRALGPMGDVAASAIRSSTGQPPEAIDSLIVGIASAETYGSVATTLAADPEPSDELPLLQREIEQLLDTSDRDRLLTLVFSPRFLVGDGGSLTEGPWAPLRDLLLAQLRDEWAAAALSVHLDEAGRLYWELRVIANAAEPESRTARALATQAGEWSGELGSVVSDGNWSRYSRAVIERSPQMLRVVGKYARRGTDGRQAVLNGYAPPGAAHQLVLAAERIVAELAVPGASMQVAATESAGDTLAERLRQPVTLSFRRESLETTLTILSDTLGVPITIRGRDLQLEGITRNQMLGLDVTETPADDALVRVLRKANPDPLAAGPADPRQRLVYVVRDNEIIVTTRAAAKQRGETLPELFITED